MGAHADIIMFCLMPCTYILYNYSSLFCCCRCYIHAKCLCFWCYAGSQAYTIKHTQYHRQSNKGAVHSIWYIHIVKSFMSRYNNKHLQALTYDIGSIGTPDACIRKETKHRIQHILQAKHLFHMLYFTCCTYGCCDDYVLLNVVVFEIKTYWWYTSTTYGLQGMRFVSAKNIGATFAFIWPARKYWSHRVAFVAGFVLAKHTFCGTPKI